MKRFPSHTFAWSMLVAILFGIFSAGSVLGYTLGSRDCAALSVEVDEPRYVPVLATYDPSMGLTLVEDPAPTPTPVAAPSTDAEAVGLILKGVEIVSKGGPLLPVGIGALIMGLVFLAGKYAPQFFPKKHLADVALFFPGFMVLGVALYAGVAPIPAFFAALNAGGWAIVLYEVVWKRLLKRWTAADEKPVLKP